MKTQICRWGNSLAVRIPQAYAEQLGLQQGTSVEIAADRDALVLRRSPHSLHQLLAEVTPDNLHGEADFGPPVGREAW